uniref:Uncharacterized protein ZSWIM9-like isoform X2 n=1 Tax=Geotrypetes seraphini TaxID=260995 RepID=A0A6P8SHQ0_GEOSA|nr:uncharacterized protein ZSWIM9-like isoform X2 [Geotrypetes seraphini]
MPEYVIEQSEAESYPISLPPMPKQDAAENYPLSNQVSLLLVPESVDQQVAAEIYPLPDLTSAVFMTEIAVKQEGMEQPIRVNAEYKTSPSALTEASKGWLKEEELEEMLAQSHPATENEGHLIPFCSIYTAEDFSLPDPIPPSLMIASAVKQKDVEMSVGMANPAESILPLPISIKQEDKEEFVAVDNDYEISPSASTEDGIKEEDVSLPLPAASEADIPSLAVTAESFPESSTCELKDKSADLKGREFFSWMDFRLFFDVWCQENKALYKIKSSTPLDKFKISRTHGTELVATLKYGFVRLACKHAFAMQSTPRNSPWESPPCPSNIILRASPCGNRLLITEAELEHNHQLSEEEVTRYFQKFKLNSKQNLLLGMTNSISKQFLEVRDLQKMVERSSGEEPILQDLLRELTVLFSMDSRAKVKLVFCPDSVAVERIFLMTSRMRCLLQRFPSALYLHRSMSVNEDFNLYTVLCEDEESMGCECAYFVAHKDSETPIRFMVVSLLQCVPDVIKPQIQNIIVDASFKEVDLIRALLPKRTVVMSQTFALETLYNRVAQEDLSVQETMRNIIHNLASAHSADVYQRNLRELEAVSLVDFLQYFLENWHYRKEIWVACWGLSQPKRSRFSDHIRFHQEKLAPVLNPSVTLATCVGGLLRLQTLKMLTATLEEDKISTLYQSVCSAASLKLIQEEISLTRQGSYEIREQTRGFVLSDTISDFFINRTMSKCSCSIYTSSLLPCRHIFATRLWAGEAIFDLKLIQEQ